MNSATLHYSREITMPSTKLEGLQNFVQLIINKIEAGDTNEALLSAVDLLNDLGSNANPYAEVTDGNGSKLIAQLRQKHAKEMGDAMAKAKADGVAEGRSMEKRAMAEKLGLV